MRTSLALLFCFLPFTQLGVSTVSADDAKPTYTLLSQRKPGQTDRVAVMMEVGGEFNERGKTERTPMSGADNLIYHELTLKADRDRPQAVRYYEKAESAMTRKDRSRQQSLAEASRLVGVRADLPAVTVFSVRQPLTRDELEVIDIQVNSLLLDRLLPDKPVAVGESWRHSEELLAAMLGLDEVAKTTVRSTLKEIKKESTRTVARFEFSGRVEGAIFGVSTASAEAGSAASEVLNASGALRREADVLRSEIDAFLSNIRAA